MGYMIGRLVRLAVRKWQRKRSATTPKPPAN
jgi:hypothetical protein